MRLAQYRAAALSALSPARLDAAALVALSAHWLALWLGIYIAVRRPRSKAAVLTGLAFVCGAVYLLKAAHYFIPTTTEAVVWRERWLGGWVAFMPALLLHAFMVLTEFKSRLRWWMLGFVYALAAGVLVWGFFDDVFSDFDAVTLDAHGYLENLPAARFYWVSIVQMVVSLALALAVLIRARLAKAPPSKVVRRQLEVLIVGVALLTVGVGQILVDGSVGAPVPDAVLFPVGVIGTVMLGVPLVRYSGRLGGQKLRSDAWSSLLVAIVALGLFVVAAIAAGASADAVAGSGWVLVAVVALSGELRSLTDRPFYGRAGREARAGLRMVETYAGTTHRIDLDSIAPSQTGELIGVLSGLDRARPAPTTRDSLHEQWLKLLAREEFEPVRLALDIPDGWKSGDRLALEDLRERMESKLLPRERQALGLWYLDYSDKEMAVLMGVKPGVPRSYLSDGKKKLGLPSGTSLMLLVHLAGFVGRDALPLSEAAASAIAAMPAEEGQP